MLSLLVNLVTVIDTGGTNELRYDNALCTVNNEGTVIGHKREVAHIDLRGLKLTRRLVDKAHAHLHVSVVSNRSVLTFLYRIPRIRIKGIVREFDGKITRVIYDRRHVAKNLVKSLFEEPFIRVLLHLNKVWHLGSRLDLRETHSNVLAKLLGFKHK